MKAALQQPTKRVIEAAPDGEITVPRDRDGSFEPQIVRSGSGG